MGMFDYVKPPYPINCKICDEQLTGWQTKSFGCNLDEFSVGDRVSIYDDVSYIADCYTSCKSCYDRYDRYERYEMTMLIENGILKNIVPKNWIITITAKPPQYQREDKR